MRIGIDFDEVLADSASAVIALHNKTFGTDYKKEEVTHYRPDKVWGGTQEEWQKKIDEFLSAKYVDELHPMAGAIPAMDALERAGHELYIITARGEADMKATEIWLGKHFPTTFKGVHYGNALAKNPEMKRSKAEMCKELGVELMIDDHIPNAEQCAKEEIRVFLFNQPWNQEELPAGVERVGSWDEVVEKLA